MPEPITTPEPILPPTLVVAPVMWELDSEIAREARPLVTERLSTGLNPIPEPLHQRVVEEAHINLSSSHPSLLGVLRRGPPGIEGMVV